MAHAYTPAQTTPHSSPLARASALLPNLASPLAVQGTSGNDSLTGTSADDTLDGGLGADTLLGGAGNDTYLVDNVGDVVVEVPGEGSDTVIASISWTLGDQVENLVLTGTDKLKATGNALNNQLTGNDGANTLDGGAGADTLAGGLGSDTYVVDSVSDVVVEAASAGTDLVKASVNWTLADNLENLTLTGSGNLNGTGNGAKNTLIGNTGHNLLQGLGGADTLSGDKGNDTLDGGSGADSLAGGKGNDNYVVDAAGDVITELLDEGTDTVKTSVSYTLSDNVENLKQSGSSNLSATGNALANTLTGNSGNNLLAGLAGNDTLLGNAGNDTLDGGAGNDSLSGGTGDDQYLIDAATDVITELAGEGSDTVQVGFTYTLGSELENLVLTGATNINGTGNAVANRLTGNSANNVLDGGLGADTLTGGAGNDVYLLDDAADSVVEAAGEGTDTVKTKVNTTLSANVENLVMLSNLDLAVTGNDQANALTGNAGLNTLNGGAGDDTLDGGTGADSLNGGAGNDLFIVDNSSDKTVEAGGEGTDSVQASVSWTLANNVEHLSLTGSGNLNGTGNNLHNQITGNSGNNLLSGDSGNDTLDGGTGGVDSLVGGTGNDTYLLSSPGDVITESSGAGIDTVVEGYADYTLATDLENLTLTGTLNLVGTGNSADNVLNGNDGNNTLYGWAGADSINGGAGNDSLIGDAGNDTLIGGAGNDVFNETYGANTFVFATGAGADTISNYSGYDGVFSDVVRFTNISSSAKFSLQGSGSDLILAYGGGSDQVTFQYGLHSSGAYYRFSSVEFSDGVTQSLEQLLANEAITMSAGNDTSYFTDYAESILGGAGADYLYAYGGNDSVSGQDGDDSLFGANGNDTIDGGAGNDSLVGDAGNDTLIGGAGDDVFNETYGANTFVFATGAGADTISNYSGYDAIYSDVVRFTNISSTAKFSLLGSGTNLILAYGNGADQVTFQNGWNSSGSYYRFGSVEFSDGVTQSLEQLLAKEVITMSAGNDTAYFTDYAESILGGAGADYLYAYGGNDSVSGQDGDDTLYGANGNDTIDGGAGNDSLVGDAGNDTFIGGVGNDTISETYGANTFVFATGAGADTIANYSGYDAIYSDVVRFTNVASTAKFSIQGAGADLILAYGNGADQITFQYGFNSNGSYYRFGSVEFSDGVTQSLEQLLATEVITMSSGNDTSYFTDYAESILGGAGADYLYAYGGNDSVSGQDGDDSLFGANGNDTIDGGAGNDSLVGDAGNDTLIGNTGNDTFSETYGANTFVFATGAGADTIYNYSGYDAIYSDVVRFTNVASTGKFSIQGAGADLILAYGGGADQITFQYGFNSNGSYYRFGSVEFSDGVTQSLEQLLATEVITMSSGNDTSYFTDYAESILGGAGADYLYAYGGNDSVSGQDGDDSLFGANGNDTIDGGAGNDSLVGDAGNDTLIGNTGNDTFSETYGANTFVFATGAGADLVYNYSGYDAIYSDVVRFTNVASTAKFSLQGAGADLILAYGNGSDQVTFQYGLHSNGSYYRFGSVEFSDGVTQSLEQLLATEVITMSSGNDTSYFTDYAESILGGAGADYLYAYGGNDSVSGQDGDDTLYGANGNDTLDGGAGNDWLYADTGSDTIVLNSKSGADFISSFTTGTDKLRVDATALAIGDGDLVLEGGVSVASGGFAKTAELVIVTNNISGAIDTTKAAAQIGSATSSYAVGQTAIFVVDNGTDSAIYAFKAADANATVSASELTLLATLSGAGSTVVGDYLFGH